MKFPEGSVELNFRMGVVTYKDEQMARGVLLHSRLIHGTEERSGDFSTEVHGWTERVAIDGDVPFDFAIVDILEEGLDEDIEIPPLNVFSGIIKTFTEDDHPEFWGNLAVGSLFHEHEIRVPQTAEELASSGSRSGWRDHTEFCIGPESTDGQRVVEAVAYANMVRKERKVAKIAELEAEEQALLSTHEVIDPAEGIFLFEGVKIHENKWGKWIVVPPRIIVSEKFGIQVLEVEGKPFNFTEEDMLGHLLFFADGSGQLFVPHIYPMEEVDERGLPVVRDRTRVSLEIRISNPVRMHRDAMEEEKLVLDTSHGTFIAEANGEYLAGNQGFGGLHFTDFIDPDNPDIYYEKIGENLADLPNRGRFSEMLFPVDDLETLLEFRMRLPGF